MFHFFALSIERTCPDLHFTTDCIIEYVTNKRTLNQKIYYKNLICISHGGIYTAHNQEKILCPDRIIMVL